MKSKIFIYGISIIILLLCVSACRKAGIWLVKEDEPRNADALVILMGSISDRVMWAADLYHENFAHKVIMVETSPISIDIAVDEIDPLTISNTMQSYIDLISLGIPADSICILPGGANSTQMEATIVRDYLTSKPEIDTILLVSSAEHLQRASMIFKFAFREAGITGHVISSPSKYTNFNAEKWWHSKEGVQSVVLEYMKMANFVLFEKKKLKKEGYLLSKQ